jgi:hypothetical protein
MTLSRSQPSMVSAAFIGGPLSLSVPRGNLRFWNP